MKQIIDNAFNNTVLRAVFTALRTCVYSRVSISQSDLERPLRAFETWVNTRGPVWAAERGKLSRLALTRYLAGQPLQEPAGLSLTKDGLPRVLPHSLRVLIRQGDPSAISLSLTLLSLSRGIIGGKPTDLDPITRAWAGSIPWGMETFIRQAVKTCGWRLSLPNWASFHWTTKAGPNGPAIATSFLDWEGLTPQLKSDLATLSPGIEEIFARIQGLADLGLTTALGGCLSGGRDFTRLRKLSVLADREAKSRVFAILDYWSQNALLPLHRAVFRLLEKLEADCTFNQGKGLSLKAPAGHSYHSLDLTSATDRFPVKLQEMLLAEMTSPEYARSWVQTLTNSEFDFIGIPVRYACGQPMGAHSSWPMFTLCHHLVVQFAAYRAGLPLFQFTDYRILGDDIVIAHDRVAAEYREILRELDVPISDTKTHTSKEMFELAKRWVYRDVEVTPFPVQALVETHKKYHLLYEVIQQAKTRGLAFAPNIGEPRSIAMLLSAFGLPERRVEQAVRNYKALLCLPVKASELEEVGHSAFALAQLFNIPFSCNIGLASAGKFLSQLAASVYASEQRRTAERSVQTYVKWTRSVQDALAEFFPQGPVDQAELLDILSKTHPGLALLTQLSEEALDSIGPERIPAHEPLLIWHKLCQMRVAIMPDGKGINPTRSSHLLSGAKATQVRGLVSAWYRHLGGRRPL